MTEFKAGDKVRITATEWAGRVGTVELRPHSPGMWPYHFVNEDGEKCPVAGHELELVAPETPAEAPVTPETGVGVSRYTKGMPEGVEARHIMSTQGWYEAFCKGSILKYITRLDHKGQYLSDLNKIKTYAEELIKLEEAK